MYLQSHTYRVIERVALYLDKITMFRSYQTYRIEVSSQASLVSQSESGDNSLDKIPRVDQEALTRELLRGNLDAKYQQDANVVRIFLSSTFTGI